jgi:EAL domain-containing protein (putative c-di-GMP-specific phosphodiesterase class I)
MRDGRIFDAEEALQHADAAMYQAKTDGRNTFVHFNLMIQEKTSREARISQKIQKAIFEKNIFPSFQPIVNIDTGEIAGFEALARWQDEDLGAISPMEFISIAERTGYIRPLGHSILSQAVETAAEASGDWILNVNISQKEIEAKDFSSKVLKVCDTFAFPPSRLCLEITESAVALQPEDALRELRSLKNCGVRLAIDDFGTGYSSFSILRSKVFDYIKIDRSFLENVAESDRDLRLVRSIVNLSREFELEVIAEGIERSEQKSILRSLGCRLAQGYLLGRPGVICLSNIYI